MQGRVAREQFRLLAGDHLVRAFAPPGGAVKAFCSVCGSSLFGGSWPEGPEISIRLGVLDGDPEIRLEERYIRPYASLADHRRRRVTLFRFSPLRNRYVPYSTRVSRVAPL